MGLQTGVAGTLGVLLLNWGPAGMGDFLEKLLVVWDCPPTPSRQATSLALGTLAASGGPSPVTAASNASLHRSQLISHVTLPRQ